MQIYGILYGCYVVMPDGRDVTFQDLVGDGFTEYRKFLFGTDDLREILMETTALCAVPGERRGPKV
jgi:hypothetical protein